jgi:ribosomal protein S18 acetylase RimI-like enzyme
MADNKDNRLNSLSTKSLDSYRQFRRRRIGQKFVYGVVSMMLMILGRGGAFVPTLSDAGFGEFRYQKRTSRKLIETVVPCSMEDETILETHFSSIEYRLQDQNDSNVEGVNMELPPVFSFHHVSKEESRDDGDLKGGSSNKSGIIHREKSRQKNDDDDNTDDDIRYESAGEKKCLIECFEMAKQLEGSSFTRTDCTKGHSNTTNVGSPRIGSATETRGNDQSSTRLVDVIQRGNSAANSTLNDTAIIHRSNKESNFLVDSSRQQLHTVSCPFNVISDKPAPRAIIESVVDKMWNEAETGVGLFDEALRQPRVPQRPKPGTVLIKSKRTLPGFAANSDTSAIDVRVATAADDLDIATLRLSVFSDLTPQTRKIFIDRSRHLLSARRRRGAVCIVATIPKNSPKEQDSIVGTAEISFHEFYYTRLGKARLKDSILYVTEVAVNSKYRRKGVASLMMESIDMVAKIRNVETIYLHVDVTNVGALRLYEKAGFQRLSKYDPVFMEFTTKLNLHDGATKGRNHFLMSKDIRSPTWLGDCVNVETQRGKLGIEV